MIEVASHIELTHLLYFALIFLGDLNNILLKWLGLIDWIYVKYLIFSIWLRKALSKYNHLQSLKIHRNFFLSFFISSETEWEWGKNGEKEVHPQWGIDGPIQITSTQPGIHKDLPQDTNLGPSHVVAASEPSLYGCCSTAALNINTFWQKDHIKGKRSLKRLLKLKTEAK